MLECEFRVSAPRRAEDEEFLASLGLPVLSTTIVYVKPHFRFRDGTLQTKRPLRTAAVYRAGIWFRWVESLERNYSRWNRKTHESFLIQTAFRRDSTRAEARQFVCLDDRALVYLTDTSVVFELETCRLSDSTLPMRELDSYDPLVLDRFRKETRSLPYRLHKHSRKPVLPATLKNFENPSPSVLVAFKLDGIFGFVHSYTDRIVEYWEDDLRFLFEGRSPLGDGYVYSAERTDRGVYLLDVYEVRGNPTANRKSILLEFLPAAVPPGHERYRAQVYAAKIEDLPPVDCPTDGFVFHDTDSDAVYKVKERYTLDLVFLEGRFDVPGTGERLRPSVQCAEGVVYECTVRGEVVRERRDRYLSNTPEQVESVLRCLEKKKDGF